MPDGSPRVRAMVLAAGAGSRFGGGKLEARVDGKPVLQHVLDVLAEAGLAQPLVVVAGDGPAGIEWAGADRATNPDPGRGLGSSLRVGWAAAMGAPNPPDAVLVVLGDQPLLRAEVVGALVAEPLDPDRPIVAPRYAATTARNPVRLEAAAATLIKEVRGDRGLGPLLDEHPELVRWVEVDGDNPDVDSHGDLATIAAAMWADRVRRNREQVDRFREAPDGADFYSSVSSIFRDDPDRTDDPVLDALRRHARSGETWLDIGAGAGRYALPLARVVRRVIALDPSPSMLDALRQGAREHDIGNVEVVEGRWPEAATGSLASEQPVDVSLIAHVGYDVEAIGPFVAAMERAARRGCVAVLMERSPAQLAEAFWPPIHGERRIALPALPAFVDYLAALGRRPTVEVVESSRRSWSSRDDVERFLQRQTWVEPGSAKDRMLQELIDGWLVATPDGGVELSVAQPMSIGLVIWEPPRA